MTTEIILDIGPDARGAAVDALSGFLRGLSPKRVWVVRVSQYRLTRSAKQNSYLNAVAYKILSDATGYERDDVSEYLCALHWGWKTQKCPKSPAYPRGFKSVPIRTTTTNDLGEHDVLSTEEFGEYVEFVQRFGAERGIYIPDPDPFYKERSWH